MLFMVTYEQDGNILLQAQINQLNQELKNFRTQFELATEAHEREIKTLNESLKQIQRMKEGALKEVCLIIYKPLRLINSYFRLVLGGGA